MIVVNLKALLATKRINQMRLSELTGLSYATINRICNDKTTEMAFETMSVICAALKCQPGDFLQYKIIPLYEG